jgi:hypothetical protein
MKIIKIIFLTTGLVLATCFNLLAQEQIVLKPGARVRLTTSLATTRPSRYVGTVIAVNADTLVLKTEESVPLLMFPLTSLTKLQVSQGRVSRGANALKGVGIGLLSGAVVGAVVGYTTGVDEDETYDCGFCYTRGTGAAFFAGVFGGFGLIVGGLMGLGWDNERWQEVPLERLRLGVSPHQNDRLLFSASFSF